MKELPDTIFREQTREEKEARIKRLLDNKTRYSYWYPKIGGLVRTPKSMYWSISYNSWCNMLDACEGRCKVNSEILDVAECIYQWTKENCTNKAFLKDFVFSSKHNWKNACFLDCEDLTVDKVLHHMMMIVNDAVCVGCEPGLGFVIREFIDTSYAPFTAFDGMPVVKEFRMWAKGGELVGYQPYWYEGAIDGHADTENDWKPVLEHLNTLTITQFLHLKRETERISAALDGFWAIDFMMCSNNKWWCIDLQEGRTSYVSPEVTWLESACMSNTDDVPEYMLRWQELVLEEAE